MIVYLELPKAVHRPRHQCCACDEAKFQMTFQGLWSKQTHPKDWPPGKNNHFDKKIATIV
jgi:hypothetical protein